MLGYRGRSNRREFIGGAALLVVGPLAVNMFVLRLLLPWMQATLERPVLIALATALYALVVGLMVAWIWGATVLATRRARDIGWPAWVGAPLATIAWVMAAFISVGVIAGLVGFMAVLPTDGFRHPRTAPAA
jgi:uncharacterized membrane protein YhaH (DUF805 family)